MSSANVASDRPRSAYSACYASPEQMRRRKIVKKGFNLCLMVCGHSGTGKSTFINTLCDRPVRASRSMSQTSKLNLHTANVEIEESDGTVIHLTVVDTPGFGDSVDNSKCCDKIVEYLEEQYDEILQEEQRVNRRPPKYRDNRVHAALYFIAPTGHGLKELDIDLMKALSERVNVVPVIAKADTLTTSELQSNKEAIMSDIRYFNIPIYDFPCDDASDEETIRECASLRRMLPFSIVGSNDRIPLFDNEQQTVVTEIRAREYPWGIVSVEDPSHSDFTTLRSVLFGSHLQELRDITHEVLYEKYRASKLGGEEDVEYLEQRHSGAALRMTSYSANEVEYADGSETTSSMTCGNSMLGNSCQSLYEERQAFEKQRAELERKKKELSDLAAKLNIGGVKGFTRGGSRVACYNNPEKSAETENITMPE